MGKSSDSCTNLHVERNLSPRFVWPNVNPLKLPQSGRNPNKSHSCWIPVHSSRLLCTEWNPFREHSKPLHAKWCLRDTFVDVTLSYKSCWIIPFIPISHLEYRAVDATYFRFFLLQTRAGSLDCIHGNGRFFENAPLSLKGPLSLLNYSPIWCMAKRRVYSV